MTQCDPNLANFYAELIRILHKMLKTRCFNGLFSVERLLVLGLKTYVYVILIWCSYFLRAKCFFEKCIDRHDGRTEWKKILSPLIPQKAS